MDKVKMDRRSKFLLIGIISFITTVALILLVIVIGVSVAANNGHVAKPVKDPTSSTKFDIIIATTLPDEVFSEGYINLNLSLPRGIRLAGNVGVYLDGIQKYSFKVLPTYLRIPTIGLENGEHNISVEAMSIDNKTGYGVIFIRVYDPTISLITINFPPVIYPGMQFEISMGISGNPSYFTANFSTIFGESEIFNSTQNDGNSLTGIKAIPQNLVTAETFYTIPIVVYSTTHKVLMIPGVKVFFQLGPTNPFTIDEGIINMRSFPSSEPTNSTLNVRIDENFEVSITTGQSIQIPLQLSQVSTGSDVLVGFEGFGQHFIIPIVSLQNPSNSRRASEKTGPENEIFFVLKLKSGSISSGSLLTMLIRLHDMAGGYGPIQRIQTVTSTSQSGTFHVRLTWNREADLDLHIVDPHNDEIYYGQRASTEQVGFLDLDSNGNCTIDHRKMENIYFELADSGEYIIRVDLYSACSVTTTINYEVLIEGCSMSQTMTGSFSHYEADFGGLGSGREVTRFNTNCMGHLVSGTVSYETPSSSSNPLGSIVRVVDSSGTIYGTSQVELDVSSSLRGIYSVPYQPDNINSYLYVEFLSSNNKIKVTDHVGVTHAYQTNHFRPGSSKHKTINVVITQYYSSGAFNIMVTLTRMLPLYLAYGGKTTDYPRIADWEYGKYAKDSDYPISYFQYGIVSIGGNPMDPDEWDESVMLHEFGHLILDRTGAVITGSGSHDGSPIPPNFAFSEGYPTYLGQKVIGNLNYCDGWCLDLSDLQQLTLGTSAYKDRSSGDISEDVVASAAFRLDFEGELGNMMTNSLTDSNKLLKESNYDKLGTTTAVDFSDMVRIVVCNLGFTKKNKADMLLNEYDLPWLSEVNFCY